MNAPYGPSIATRVPGGSARERGAVVAEVLDGDPQAVRRRAPPRASTDAPATTGRGAGSATAGTGRRRPAAGRSRRPRSTTENVPGPSGATASTVHAVAQRAPHRQHDAAADDERERPDPQRRPPRPRPRVADERRAGVDLVREGQEQREVGVEVHRPPGLVGQPPAGEPVGRHARGDQQREARPSRRGCPGRSTAAARTGAARRRARPARSRP